MMNIRILTCPYHRRHIWLRCLGSSTLIEETPHMWYLGRAQPFGRALLAGPSLSPLKFPRGNLSASAGSIAHTRAFSTPDQCSTYMSSRALSSHLRENFSLATQDNWMLASTPELHHEKSSMSVAVASGFIREPSITTPLHGRNASDRLLSSSETSTRKLSPTGAAPQESLGKSEALWNIDHVRKSRQASGIIKTHNPGHLFHTAA
jgi:hypothetical protein